MKKLIVIALIVFVISLGLYFVRPVKAGIDGKILLQVENRGEAWYINPQDGRRYYLKDGETFYKIVQDLGVGISNEDLKKIPVALDYVGFYGLKDTDHDGLPDQFETALGTSILKSDTDNDGYKDSDEISTGHDPVVRKEDNGDIIIDKDFAEYTKGKILLQVQNKGEAWYVNPTDGKRYYLYSPKVAFEVMKSLGIGAKNDVIENIEEGLIKRQKVAKVRDGDSIEMANGQIVRYIGIDAPEISYPDCFGQQAKDKNKQLLEGKEVILVQDVSVKDNQGRFLAYIYVDGLFVNEYMVTNGYAYALSYYPDVKYSSQFSEAQRKAKYDRIGLWGQCFK